MLFPGLGLRPCLACRNGEVQHRIWAVSIASSLQCWLVVCRHKAKLHLEQILVMINKPPKWNDQVTFPCRSWRHAPVGLPGFPPFLTLHSSVLSAHVASQLWQPMCCGSAESSIDHATAHPAAVLYKVAVSCCLAWIPESAFEVLMPAVGRIHLKFSRARDLRFGEELSACVPDRPGPRPPPVWQGKQTWSSQAAFIMPRPTRMQFCLRSLSAAAWPESFKNMRWPLACSCCRHGQPPTPLVCSKRT